MASFEEVKAKCDLMRTTLKKLDYGALKTEIRNACNSAHISSGTMTPNELAGDMDKIQSARDRIVEIMADAQENSVIRKDISKMMIAAAKKNSSESSSDRRDADANTRVSDYVLEYTKAESFSKYCETMYAGLTNKYNSVGKRIACMQESVRLSQFGGVSSMVSDMAQPKDTSSKFDKPQGDSQLGTHEVDWDNL